MAESEKISRDEEFPLESISVPEEDLAVLNKFLKDAQGWFGKTPELIDRFCLHWKKMCFRSLIADIVEEFIVQEAPHPITKDFVAGESNREVDKECVHHHLFYEHMNHFGDEPFALKEAIQNGSEQFRDALEEILKSHLVEMGSRWGIEFGEIKKGDIGPRGDHDVQDKNRLVYSQLPQFDYDPESLTVFVIHPLNDHKFPVCIKTSIEKDECVILGHIGNDAKEIALISPEKDSRERDDESEEESDQPKKVQKKEDGE